MTDVFTISEAAEIIGISRPTLYRYLKRPQYIPAKVAGHPTISRAQIEMIKIERGQNGTVPKRPKKRRR